jgi:hypothetical protein
VTVPDFGPEVHAGPPVDTRAGIPISLDAAFIGDVAGNGYECVIEWRFGEPDGALHVFDTTQDGGDAFGCTVEILRAATTVYDVPEGDFDDHVVRVTVFGRDGRHGQAITRVRVRP